MKALQYATLTVLFAFMTIFPAFGLAQVKTNNPTTVEKLSPDKVTSTEEEIHFEIQTRHGNMKGKLYNSTPLHRDNFIKLINEKYYDSLLFHRVIRDFMIQGGDPESRGAEPNKALGNGGPNYTLPAEIRSDLFHKKGALSAARQPDNVNPEKRSSGSQFYVVQGRKYTDQMLKTQEMRMNQSKVNQAIRTYLSKPENKADLERITYCQKNKLNDSLNKIVASLVPVVISKDEQFQFTEQQRLAYSGIGGTPHLDANYTVFGEIYEGLEVIDKIATSETDGRDRPIQDVKMSIRIVSP